MSRKGNYVQCAMRRSIAGGSMSLTSYIPQEFAKLGRTLRLKDDHDGWTSGWVVEIVGGRVVDGDSLPNYRKAIRNHRVYLSFTARPACSSG